MKLQDKIVIVTGSNQNVGKEIAVLFSHEGAKVVLVGRDDKKGLLVKKEIEKAGGETIYIHCDVTNVEQVKNLVSETINRFGRIDILVNNVGYGKISKITDINLITIFRNHGSKAGTSLVHPHSQIIATPIVPPHVRYPLEQAVLYFDNFGRCVYCDMIEEERKQKERLIIDTDNFLAFCPYAARTPFETRIYPKRHMTVFSHITDGEIEELAWVLRNVLLKLHICLDNPDYNYVIRSAPVGEDNARYLHWYMVIIPKITTRAGFEIGSGIYINSVPPEDSARYLRETKTDG